MSVVIVTGASRGLGAATALFLAKAGCQLVLAARSKEPLEALVQKIGADQAMAVSVDVADADGCAKLVDQTIARHGRLHALINNAGMIEPIGPGAGLDPAAWKRNLEVNLLGPFYLCQAALPHLRKTQGKIVNVSTGAAVHPISGWTAYCTAKAGLHHLTRTLAVEEPQVTCLSLRPGVIDTEMQGVIRRDGDGKMPADMVTYFKQLKEQDRLEPPEVPGRALAWCALHAPHEWTGEFVEYGDPKVAGPAQQIFG